MRNITRHRVLSLIVLFLGMVIAGQETKANPNFSRKYKLACATCHTVPPQLTRAGIEFRRLGYRFPKEFQNETSQPIKSIVPDASQQNSQAVQLLEKAGCMSCHSIDPNSEGRSLPGVGAKRSIEEIRSFIKSNQHTGSAAADELDDNEYEIVVVFLASLKTTTALEKDSWKYDFADFISVRGRAYYKVKNVSNSDTKNEFRFNDMTFYYLGPVNRYLTIFFETAYEEGFEPDVLAQGTVYLGNADRYGYLKVGHMRLVRQGVSLLDRSKTISTDGVVSGKSNKFALNTDQRGIEVGLGFNQNKTLVRGFLTNGIDSTGNGRPVGRQDLNKQKDFALIIENLFGEKTATSLSAVYYHGATPTFSGNINFDRVGLLGSLAFNNKQNFEDFRVNGGVLYGRDKAPNQDDSVDNLGFILGIDKRLGDMFYLSARYDQFNPDTDFSSLKTNAYTFGIMKQLITYLRVAIEYQLFYRPNDIKDQAVNAEFYMFF